MRKLQIVLFSLTSLFSSGALSQEKASDFNTIFGLPSFILQTFDFPGKSPATTRVEINLALVNDILQFVHEPDGAYAAGYEIGVDLLDEDGALIKSQLDEAHIRCSAFEETNSRQKYNPHRFNFEVQPGNYQLHLEIVDLETRKRLEQQEAFTVRSFPADTLQISSIVFLRDADGANGPAYNLPKFYRDEAEAIRIEFTLSGLQNGEEVSVQYTLKDWQENVLSDWQESLAPDTSQVRVARTLNEHIAAAGNYTLAILCTQGDIQASDCETFSVHYQPQRRAIAAGALPPAKDYLPLRYICDKALFKKIAEADSANRHSLIEAFWRERDPTPGDGHNELRAEYESRVEFANKHFSIPALQKNGWDTDRGRIYLLHGTPTWVRTLNNEFGAAALEIWYYASIDIRFVFRDKKGNGHYKLIQEE